VGESPGEAAVREAREECGLRISLGSRIGMADELVFAADEATYYRKRCVFLLAELVEQVGAGEPDHELIWLPAEQAATELRHESQRWAVAEACRLLRNQGHGRCQEVPGEAGGR
jgi:8-oxo-dGTP pyrophosphatase MutT (NUDIX family)